MTSIIHTRYLILVGLVLLLVGTPAAILAADAGRGTTTLIHLPIVRKPSSTASTGTLGNGGTFEGPDGVGIGALTDTLTAPIQVTIAVTSPPTVTLPTPANSLGGFYHIGSGQDVLVSPENPLILAFPISAGANTANLALAMLETGAGVLDAEGRGAAWILLEGMIEPTKGLFLTTFAGPTLAGNTFALVEHPDIESPPNNLPRTADGGDAANSSQFNLFTVHCIGFANPADCTDVTEATVAGYLTDIYDHVHGDLGFGLPRLRFMNETLEYNPNSLNVLGYSAYIEPSNSRVCDENGGLYQVASGRLVLCLNPSVGLDSNSLLALIHEYFHATQYGYPAVLADAMDGSSEEWIIEGMATSAMESYFVDEMVRTDYFPDLHLADVSLKSNYDIDEYLTQDFWVYYGQIAGQGLPYLAPILQNGASSQAVVDTLDSSGEVLSIYWFWVKNHLMEPAIDYDGKLGTDCELETGVVGLLEHMDVGGYSPPFADFLIDPLGTIVVELHFDWDGYTQADGRVFPVPDPNLDPIAAQALQYKFYEEGEIDCHSVPDTYRTYWAPDPAKQYFVVITNTDHDNSHDYRVTFEYGPTPP